MFRTPPPPYGVAGTIKPKCCREHAKDGMVGCTHRRCTTIPVSLNGTKGTKTAKFCSQHARRGMVNVAYKRCAHKGCTTHPSKGTEGIRTAVFCSKHAKDGMVDVISRRCAHQGCTKSPSLLNKMMLYCNRASLDQVGGFAVGNQQSRALFVLKIARILAVQGRMCSSDSTRSPFIY